MKEDIFDKLMKLPILNTFNPFYKKYKEQFLYLFFGGCTMLVSIGSFAYFLNILKQNVLIANIISWFLAVFFAFVTNRTWVFKAKNRDSFIKQGISFYSGRLFTLGIEEFILYVFITLLAFNGVIVKVFAQVVVLASNYVISKFFIFRE